MSEFDFTNKGDDLHRPDDLTLPVVVTLDGQLAKAKVDLSKYNDLIQDLIFVSEEIEVNNEVTVTSATDMTARVMSLLKTIDAERKRIIAPTDKFVRAINAFVLPYKKKLNAVTDELKTKIGTYDYQLELERRKEAKRLEDELAKKQAEFDRQADEAKVERIPLPKQVLPVKREPVRSEAGSTSTKMVWTFEIEDWSKIDRCHLEAIGRIAMETKPKDSEHHPVINKVFKPMVVAGIREIPGVKIFEKPVVSVRAA